MKHSHESIHLTNRGRVAAGVLVGAVALGGLVASKEGTRLVHDAITNVHNLRLSNQFDDPGLARNFKSHDIDPASVATYTIKGGDTPESIAVKMGATEDAMPWVKKVVAGQEGGEYKLQPNDEVIIPKEWLDSTEKLGAGPQG